VSGPPYPNPSPAPGSNAIGIGAIGIMQIGAIAEFNPWTPIISQYRNSPRLDAIILAFNAAMDQTENLSDLYDMIWNVLTAEGYGLDVWGRIVGISRTLKFPSGVAYLGMGEANSWTGFGQGGFYSGAGTSNNFILSDADFRTLILAKAAGNISDGTIQSINQILLTLFPNRGAAYVADNQNMSCTLTFKFALTPVELAIIEQANVLPIPAGVAVIISQL
jgi:hypothetical protein